MKRFVLLTLIISFLLTSLTAAAPLKVRLTWPLTPSAVKYQVVFLKNGGDFADNIALAVDNIYTTGVEVDLSAFGEQARNFYWKVCPLTFEGTPLGHFSLPRPLLGSGEMNPASPLPTTEFGQMAEFPLYPVFSWIPSCGAKHHQVEVYRETPTGLALVRHIKGGEYNVYETVPYTQPGDYFWRVRAVTAEGEPLSDWSAKSPFHINERVTVAALGDSITHGGGAVSVPPSFVLYDWETYAGVAVKNLGLSGNTTAMMVERFQRDVLPFKPKILVVMGGVNDFRGDTFGWSIVQNLAAIRDLCYTHSIVPVFVTVTPINAYLLELRGVEFAPGDWQVHQAFVNDWIMQQKYHVDVAKNLTDEQGNLRSMYSTDGLHPDYYGKKHIGETIGRYLREKFPHVVE